MKAEITYNLNNKDEQMALQRALKSTDMAIAIFEMLINSRKKVEYQIENSDKELSNYDAIHLVYEQFDNILDEQGINLDELID